MGGNNYSNNSYTNKQKAFFERCHNKMSRDTDAQLLHFPECSKPAFERTHVKCSVPILISVWLKDNIFLIASFNKTFISLENYLFIESSVDSLFFAQSNIR